jgi:hypothetical protein
VFFQNFGFDVHTQYGNYRVAGKKATGERARVC